MLGKLFIVLLASVLVSIINAFIVPAQQSLPSSHTVKRSWSKNRSVIKAGLFDGLFNNDEARRRKEEDYQKQQEILRNRQDPKKQQAYFQEVNKRRKEVSENISEKFNLGKGGKDPAIKWMELRKQGKIKDREKYEGQETNRGIVIPQVPFGKPAYDNGERFDLRLPYVDDGYVDPEASLGNTIKRLFGMRGPSKPTTLPPGPGSSGPQKREGKK